MVIAHELGLKLEVLPRPQKQEEFRRINPLGKIPALVMNDGSAIFDSPVICEYLNQQGGGKFFPGNSILRGDEGKWRALTLQALGDDVAACSAVYYWPKDKRGQDDKGKQGILHVKCAVADGRWLFLSSANLTEYAFTINMELGVLVTGGKLPAQVQEHFERLIATGNLSPV